MVPDHHQQRSVAQAASAGGRPLLVRQRGANGVEALEDALHEALGAPNCLPVVRRDVLVLLASLQEQNQRTNLENAYSSRMY